MGIIATHPAPAGRNLADQDTHDLAAYRIPRPRPANTGCPTWCQVNHAGQPDHIDDFELGRHHESTPVEVTADSAVTIHGPAAAVVYVERVDQGVEVVQPTRIVVTVAQGTDGVYPGGDGTQGWAGTPEQAEQLAQALIEAARAVRSGGAR